MPVSKKPKLTKAQLKKYLAMNEDQLLKLSDSKAYQVVEGVVEEMTKLQEVLGDLQRTYTLLRDQRLVNLFKEYDSNVLQIRGLLIAEVTRTNVSWKAVVDNLVDQRPKLAGLVQDLVDQQTSSSQSIRTALAKNPGAKFPKPKGKTVRVAGAFDWVMKAKDKVLSAILSVWPTVKDAVTAGWVSLSMRHNRELAKLAREFGVKRAVEAQFIREGCWRVVAGVHENEVIKSVTPLTQRLCEVETTTGLCSYGTKEDLLPEPLLRALKPLFQGVSL